MIKRFILYGAIALAFAACTTESLSVAEPDTQETAVSDKYESGHLRVLFNREMAERLELASDNAGGILSSTGTKAVDDAFSRMGAVRIERTFPNAGVFEKRTREAGLDRWYDIYFDEDYPVTKASADLGGLDGAEIVECRPKMVFNQWPAIAVPAMAFLSSEDAVFDDPDFTKQWNFFNTGGATYFKEGCDVDVLPAWKEGKVGSPDVIVAVVDQGVDYLHEDLADNMWTVEGPDGQIIHGYNFVKKNFNIMPGDHGTHVAGVIAAVNNNGKGVCGIAGGDFKAGKQGVRIMSCQISVNDDSWSDAATAIKWAADHGAVIAQNSWGYVGARAIPYSDRVAIDYFNTYAGFDENGNQVGPMAGGLVVFAAGNESDTIGIPAQYEGVLAVTSVASDFKKAYYSNYGDWTDIIAPGGDPEKSPNVIYSTITNNRYGMMAGTSMACPHVSGVAALLVSELGGLGFTREMLWNRLVNTAKDLSEYNSGYSLGSGLVDAYAALKASSKSDPEPVHNLKARTRKSNFIDISFTLSANGRGELPANVNVYYSDQPISEESIVPSKMINLKDRKAGDEVTETISGFGFNKKYYFRCVSFDKYGKKSPMSEQVTATTGSNHNPVIIFDHSREFDVKASHEVHLPFSFSDEDGHAIGVSLVSGSAADTLNVTGDDNAEIVVLGWMAAPGKYTSTIVVRDEYDASTTLSYTYRILENHPPVKKKEIEDIVLGVKGQSVVLDMNGYIEDEDGDDLKYSGESSDNSIVSVTGMSNRLTITPFKYGQADVSVKVTDPFDKGVEFKFKVVVRDGSRPVDIYPNPVIDGRLYVRASESAKAAVKVISSTGACVLSGEYETGPFSPALVNFTDIPGGIYTVEVTIGGNVIKETIVKI